MADTMQIAFLCQKLKELRTTNGLTMDKMAEQLGAMFYGGGYTPNKSSLSRLEAGKVSERTLLGALDKTGKLIIDKKTNEPVDIGMARRYCKVFGMTDNQIEQFLRGDRIAVPDTSALLKNPQLIDELNKEYSIVIIPKVVVDELNSIKDRTSGALGKKAWEVLRGISYGPRTISKDYVGNSVEENNDCKIIAIARAASEEYHCRVEIITDDTDFAARLDPDESVRALHLREYMMTKQSPTKVNMIKVSRLNEYYADSYEGIDAPTQEEANAFLPDGNTLIISVVRNRRPPLNQRKAKIAWLIEHGADINKRDCGRRYIPPISHAIQAWMYEDRDDDLYQLFLFMLQECHADPNIGSRNPFASSQVRQKNEGNMPLMIAAYDGKPIFIEALLRDERTSINQQDSNGFTALMKASMNGWTKCIRLLKNAGADEKIVDIGGRTKNGTIKCKDAWTAEDWYHDYLENGSAIERRTKNRQRRFDQRGYRK